MSHALEGPLYQVFLIGPHHGTACRLDSLPQERMYAACVLRTSSWLLTFDNVFECRPPSKLEVSWLQNACPCPPSLVWARPLQTAYVQKNFGQLLQASSLASGWATSHATGAQDSRDSRDSSVKKRTTKMTMTTHSCFRSAALLSARQSFAPFTRKAPQSRRITPSTCFHHPPSWFPHLKPETLLVQVSPSCCPIAHAGSQSSLPKAHDAGRWAVLILLCSHAVMLHFRQIALLIALLIPLVWIAQRLSQVRSLDSVGLVAL